MDSNTDLQRLLTRRRFLELSRTGIGAAALATLWQQDVLGQGTKSPVDSVGGLAGLPHFAPKAKRVIYLFQAGAPSQHELWEYKPKVVELSGTELPESIRAGQRRTAMTASQASFPVIPSKFPFAQHGESGAWISELMPLGTVKVSEAV